MHADVIALFGQLANVSRAERERYYEDHAVSAAVREDLESLFHFDGENHVALDRIVSYGVSAAFAEPVTDGGYCGPFRLLRQIGRGGMGVVYLAERMDGEVRQQVAVKLLQAVRDSGDARQRFLQERQILASLAHPNIARLIDAGHRDDGFPYLVMEYIEGQPIDDYCRGRTAREAAELMLTLAEAIASAHQQLVVHRDLKPGNILVDAGGRPRVLDFGIAKMLDASDSTVTVERRLTPDYASPEQLAGAPVTTATDIYSLGAVLRTLLGVVRPGAASADLDAIVRKATRAEPADRYPAAGKLAEDLRAWLDGRPVEARRGERWYGVRRRLRRHWVLVAATLIAAAGLVGGLLTARAERDAAQRRFDEVRQLANEFFAIEKEVQNLPGSTAVRERIVKTSIRYLEGLARQAGDDWRLKAEIAAGYRLAAEAQGLSRTVNLGRGEDAQRSLDRAAALMKEVTAAAPGDRTVLRDSIALAELQLWALYSNKQTGALEGKIEQLRTLLARYEPQAREEVDEWRFIGRTYESMAVAARDASRFELPMEFARRAVELRRKTVGADPGGEARASLSNALTAYSRLQRATGDLAGAVGSLREALSVTGQVQPGQGANPYKVQLNLANMHASLARNLGDVGGPSLGQTDAARRHFEESLRISRPLLAFDANDRMLRYNHSLAAWRLGDLLRATEPARALALYDEAIGILRPMPARQFSRDMPLVAALAESTPALRALGRESQVEPRLREARAIADTYRASSAAIHHAAVEIVTRAEASQALAQRRPLVAAATLARWLELEGEANLAGEALRDSNTAFQLAQRYGLLREAWLAAARPAEAGAAERKRRELVAHWKTRLPAGNGAETILR
ncbi:MAG: serine/threonine protein kinase [Bryobacterales bacterium]|nr:serine/threonine protein kinase [Bryobacterales bacterium]